MRDLKPAEIPKTLTGNLHLASQTSDLSVKNALLLSPEMSLQRGGSSLGASVGAGDGWLSGVASGVVVVGGLVGGFSVRGCVGLVRGCVGLVAGLSVRGCVGRVARGLVGGVSVAGPGGTTTTTPGGGHWYCLLNAGRLGTRLASPSLHTKILLVLVPAGIPAYDTGTTHSTSITLSLEFGSKLLLLRAPFRSEHLGLSWAEVSVATASSTRVRDSRTRISCLLGFALVVDICE